MNWNKEKCDLCGECAAQCPFSAIEISDGRLGFTGFCVECGACAQACAKAAITAGDMAVSMDKADKSQYSGFWVVGEADRSGKLKKVTLELVSEAKKLTKKRGVPVTVVLLAPRVKPEWKEALEQLGCNRILLLKTEQERYTPDVFSEALTRAILQEKPEAVIFPATPDGRDLAPRISCSLRTGLTADCTGLDVDENGDLLQIRPTYGGSIMATIRTPEHRPQLASVRPGVMEVRWAEKPVRAEVITLLEALMGDTAYYPGKSRRRESAFDDISEAAVVIAGGYGLGSKDNFQMLYRLCEKLNAAPAATRKAVDEGWASTDIQVGQTGKTVAPELYIAFGVSGALQHTLGMKRARKVIAVNNDPAAQIMGVSDMAILGDAPEVLRALLELLR